MKLKERIFNCLNCHTYKILRENKYVLESEKIKKDLNIVLFSDIHYKEKYNYQKLREIIRYVFEERPDYVLIPGDLIDDSRLDKTLQSHIVEFIHAIANYVPVKISLGNHDIMTQNEKQGTTKHWSMYKNYRFLNRLNEISNVTILDNTVENLDDEKISFSGITLPVSHYEEAREDQNDLVEILESDEKKEVVSNINEDNYRIMLFHSPANILENKVLEKTKINQNVDLVVSGHMHGGVVPKWLSKRFGTRGLISPTKKLFPNWVRGHIRYQNMDAIISTGIQKLNFKLCDRLLKPEINKIIIKKK